MAVPIIEVDDILAHYLSPRHIGGGGQKLVFVVNDAHRGELVLKIGGYRSQQALQRAQREVSTLSGISSQYFPEQYGFEIIDDHRYAITEEYLPGVSLAAVVADFAAEPKLINLLLHLTRGLSELWRRRVVHRDVKPANILITPTGPKIIDLGIARLLDCTSLTHSFAPIGPCTPAYASPEQLRNRKRDIDHRSDQFSLGIVSAQLAMSGTHPFDTHLIGGDSVPENILGGRWARDNIAARVSDPLLAVVTRLLAPEPYMRYRRGKDILDSLEKAL